MKELENTNVSVTVSLPGYVRTNIHKRSGLEHLTKKIPNWMWISADKVVADTEKASRKENRTLFLGFCIESLVSSLISKLQKLFGRH
jgi:short-subunit dehydrogenase